MYLCVIDICLCVEFVCVFVCTCMCLVGGLVKL